MTKRVEQVESVIKRALAQTLSRDISDPRIEGLVSITDVDISPDLREARIGVSVLPDKYEKRTLAGLRAAAGHIHGRLKKRVDMRIVPHLNFVLDRQLKKQAEVLDALRHADDTVEPMDLPDSPELD